MPSSKPTIYLIAGCNGAGKTTCFYMIIGIIAADKGTITVNGEDITALSMHKRARRGIGYLPQDGGSGQFRTAGGGSASTAVGVSMAEGESEHALSEASTSA